MNKLLIPPAANWYRSQICVCAPDNTFIYGSRGDIVTISDKFSDGPPDVRIIPHAHSSYVISVDINKKWGSPNKHIVSVGEDKIVSIFDLETYEKKCSNKEFHDKDIVGATFAGDDRIVSVTVDGVIMVWNIHTNETNIIKIFDSIRAKVTCLSSCPHVGWLTAFGLFNGSIIVADLRRKGKILYKMQGHAKTVLSLAWCPAPVNIFPLKPQNIVINKSTDEEVSVKVETVKEDSDSQAKNDKNTIRRNLTYSEDKVDSSREQSEEQNDFLKECQQLKDVILGLTDLKNDSNKRNDESTEKPENEEEILQEFSDFNIQDQEVQEGRELPQHFDPSDNLFTPSPVQITGEDKCFIDTKCKEKPLSDSSPEKDSEINIYKIGKDIVEEIIENVLRKEEIKDAVMELKVEMEEPRKEYLLASSGRDRSIYIWRGGTDGRLQTFFSLPKKSKKQMQKDNTWVTLCWPSPDTLITTSGQSDYLIWSLPKPKDTNKHYRYIKHKHSLLFNVVAPMFYPTEYNWREKRDLKIWTFGQSGLITNEDLNNNIFLNFQTLTTIITCFSISPLDPNRMEIGFKDGTLRLWDLSQPNKREINFINLKKIPGKITCLNWHPNNENLLAFGNEEGKVGYIDLRSNKCKILSFYFNNTVHNCEWGPINGDVNNLGIYAVSDGKLIFYNLNNENDGPEVMVVPENTFIYRFAWKPDFTILLINTKDGGLMVYSNKLEIQTTLYINEKGFTNIIWHPDAKNNDPVKFPYCNWFAATTLKDFVTYDSSNFNDNSDDKYSCFDTFSRNIKALAWSPFDGSKLVISLENGHSHIWDVPTKTIISTYLDPYGNDYGAICWSPIDPDLIIMGDKLLTIWKVSENPPQLEELTETKKKIENKTKKNKKKDKKNNKDFFIPPLFSSTNDDDVDFQIENFKKIKNSEYSGLLNLFGDKENVVALLNETQNNNKRDRKYKFYNLASLWKGDLGIAIREAIQENRITPFLLNLAPMVSPKLWQEACDSYARKQSEDPDADPLEVVSYFLACHKIQEAINFLCSTALYKEALSLAKCRLPDDCDIIRKVTLQWAQHCIIQGNFEIAAICFISINEYGKAAQILARRNNEKILNFAAELAEEIGNEELKKSIIFKMVKIKENQMEDDSMILNPEIFENTDILTNDKDDNNSTSLMQKLGLLLGLNTLAKTEKTLTRAEVFFKKSLEETDID